MKQNYIILSLSMFVVLLPIVMKCPPPPGGMPRRECNLPRINNNPDLFGSDQSNAFSLPRTTSHMRIVNVARVSGTSPIQQSAVQQSVVQRGVVQQQSVSNQAVITNENGCPFSFRTFCLGSGIAAILTLVGLTAWNETIINKLDSKITKLTNDIPIPSNLLDTTLPSNLVSPVPPITLSGATLPSGLVPPVLDTTLPSNLVPPVPPLTLPGATGESTTGALGLVPLTLPGTTLPSGLVSPVPLLTLPGTTGESTTGALGLVPPVPPLL